MKVWATFSRSTEDTKNLKLAKLIAAKKKMLVQHNKKNQKSEPKITYIS